MFYQQTNRMHNGSIFASRPEKCVRHLWKDAVQQLEAERGFNSGDLSPHAPGCGHVNAVVGAGVGVGVGVGVGTGVDVGQGYNGWGGTGGKEANMCTQRSKAC